MSFELFALFVFSRRPFERVGSEARASGEARLQSTSSSNPAESGIKRKIENPPRLRRPSRGRVTNERNNQARETTQPPNERDNQT